MFFLRSTTFTSPLSSCFTRHLNLQENNSQSFNSGIFYIWNYWCCTCHCWLQEKFTFIQAHICPNVLLTYNVLLSFCETQTEMVRVWVQCILNVKKKKWNDMRRGKWWLKFSLLCELVLASLNCHTQRELKPIHDTGKHNLFYERNKTDKWDRHCQFHTHRKTKSI